MSGRLMLLAVPLAWLIGLAAPAQGQAEAGGGTVRAIPGGHEVELVDGRRLRLAGLLAPAAEGPEDALGDSLARAARDALAGLVEAREVRFALAAPAPDRHGRPVVWLRRAGDGLDVQQALLAGGHAMLFATADAATRIEGLRAAERTARAAGAGLWAQERFRIRDAARGDIAPGRYSLVRGRVTAARKVGGTIYLDFGEDWRRDFTVVVPWNARRLLPVELREADAWPGRRLEVRGMTGWRNGPTMTLIHPAQIEFPADDPTR